MDAPRPLPALLYLDAAAVEAAMPPLEERLQLAERTMLALGGDGELPPKIGVHPRPAGSFAHAMPAWLDGHAEDASADLLGLKWVAGFPANREVGRPAIHATVILNDPASGIPTAILDGAPITAHRTAAVTAVAVRRWAPRTPGRPTRAAILGAGVQGRSHLPVVGALLPGVELTLYDRHVDRAAVLAEVAAATPGVGAARVAASAELAAVDADVVITGITFGARRQTMDRQAFQPHALIVAIDYDMCCAASVAREADLFLVDDRAQFLAVRATGPFAGYPDPGATIGEALVAETSRPQGQVLVTPLGVGLADVIFGAAIVARARERGLGQTLPR
jgi:ornithine cyclodeaminase/alanine dehydrogenase-like protein (mu-crystallin family)